MTLRHLLPLACFAILGLSAPSAHAAGILCGIIRDAMTLAPITRAGIFLRTPAGAYTGENTATDSGGNFCLGGLTAGTYDIEVRVDDYRRTYRRNVVVVDDVSAVDIPVAPLPVRMSPPTPNPARFGSQLAFTLAEPAAVRLKVFDPQGRVIVAWRQETLEAGRHAVTWDLRDAAGRAVPAGLYFIQLEALGVTLTRTISRIRG